MGKKLLFIVSFIMIVAFFTTLFVSSGYAIDYKMLIGQLDDDTIVGYYPLGVPKRKRHEAYDILQAELKKKPPDSRLVDLLVEAALGSQSPSIRFGSTLLLNRIKTESILSILETVLDTDKDTRVRKGAARGIGFFREERSIPILVEALSDQSLDVRIEAITALGRIGRSATPTLIKMMETELAREKIRAVTAACLIRALTGTKDRRAMGVLMRAASHKSPSIRADSVIALRPFAVEGRRYGREGKICVVGAPVDPRYETQESDRQEAEAAIIRALSDPDEAVRKNAERSIEDNRQIIAAMIESHPE